MKEPRSEEAAAAVIVEAVMGCRAVLKDLNSGAQEVDYELCSLDGDLIGALEVTRSPSESHNEFFAVITGLNRLSLVEGLSRYWLLSVSTPKAPLKKIRCKARKVLLELEGKAEYASTDQIRIVGAEVDHSLSDLHVKEIWGFAAPIGAPDTGGISIQLAPHGSTTKPYDLKGDVETIAKLPDNSVKLGRYSEFPHRELFVWGNLWNGAGASLSFYHANQFRDVLSLMPRLCLPEAVTRVWAALWLGSELVLLRGDRLGWSSPSVSQDDKSRSYGLFFGVSKAV